MRSVSTVVHPPHLAGAVVLGSIVAVSPDGDRTTLITDRRNPDGTLVHAPDGRAADLTLRQHAAFVADLPADPTEEQVRSSLAFATRSASSPKVQIRVDPVTHGKIVRAAGGLSHVPSWAEATLRRAVHPSTPLYLAGPDPRTPGFAERVNDPAHRDTVVRAYLTRTVDESRALSPHAGSVFEVALVGAPSERNGRDMATVRYIRLVWVRASE